MGIYKGSGERDMNPEDDDKNFNNISNSVAIYKLSLQKIFKLDDVKLFYYPYFSNCCEDTFFNAIASKYCYRLNQYKLRFGHFKNTGDHNDVLIDEINYQYNNKYPDKKMYYNHILKYMIDLKKLFKNQFKFVFGDNDKFQIIINKKTIFDLGKAMDKDTNHPEPKNKYAKYQIILFVLYSLFEEDEYKNVIEKLNYYGKYYRDKLYYLPYILKTSYNYCLYLFRLRKYKKINDSRVIQRFATDLEKHLDNKIDVVKEYDLSSIKYSWEAKKRNNRI